MKKQKITASYDYIIDNNEIWFLPFGRNFLCKRDCATQETETFLIDGMEIDRANEQFYQTILKIGNKILLVPRVAKKMAIFHCEKKEMTYLEVPESIEVHNSMYEPDAAEFWRGFTYEKYFFLLGFGYPGIVRVDSESFDVIVINDWHNDFEKLIQNTYIGYFANGLVLDGEKAVIPFYGCCACLELDLSTLSGRVLPLDLNYNGIHGISGDHNAVWITGWGKEDNYLTKWDGKSYERIKICEKTAISPLFYPPLEYRDRLFIVPYRYSDKIYCYEKNSNEIFVWKTDKQVPVSEKKTFYSFMEPKIVGDKLVLVSGASFEWIVIDLITGEEDIFCIDISGEEPEEEFLAAYYRACASRNLVIDELLLPLETFCEFIKKGELCDDRQAFGGNSDV